jgi:hypothetical protein
MKCPPHGFEYETIVTYFYRGLTPRERNSLDTMYGKEFLSLTGDEAYKALDEMAERAQQWEFQNSWDRQDPAPKTRGMYEVKEDTELREEVKEIKRQLATLVLNKPMNGAEKYQANVWGYVPVQCTSLRTSLLCQQKIRLRKLMPSMSIENPQVDLSLKLTIQGGGITQISHGSRISH